MLDTDAISKLDISLATELDWQLYKLQRKYLDYQVNIGNRIIQVLQSGAPDAAEQAQKISEPKKKFQDIMDDLFSYTARRLSALRTRYASLRSARPSSPTSSPAARSKSLPYCSLFWWKTTRTMCSSWTSQEVSLHVDWQKRLIDLIMDLNPNVQLILTTHSPAVIMNGWMDKVTEVSEITDQ